MWRRWPARMRGAIHAVLDFLVTFFIKKKGKDKNYL
jgi:hypothetical protein